MKAQETKKLENEIQTSIDEQLKNDQKQTEEILQKLEERDDKCLDIFATAKKLKEIQSGRLNLEENKAIEEELDEF